MTLLTQSNASFILDNIADAIEGGSSYRGSGAGHPGVPGILSVHELASDGSPTTLTATSGNGTGTTFTSTTLAAAQRARLVRTGAAPFFVQCATQASGSLNVGAARKITAIADETYTVDPAFPEAVASGDTLLIKEGFRRLPDNIESIGKDPDARTAAFDRGFRLSMGPGEELDICGSGTKRYQSELMVQLRLVKRGRDQDTIASALENMLRIHAALVDGARRDGTYAQGLFAYGVRPEIEDKGDHVQITDKLRIVYRIHGKLS